MKVVKNETPKEKVKFTNVFGDEYTPEEYEFICDDCLAEEVESLKEDVVWLAKDILDHDSALEMLWKKIQSVEDDQLQDAENLSRAVDILGCLQEASKLMLDVIIEQDRQIKEFKSKHNSLARLMCVNLIWIAVLTVLFWIYVL